MGLSEKRLKIKEKETKLSETLCKQFFKCKYLKHNTTTECLKYCNQKSYRFRIKNPNHFYEFLRLL